MDGFAITTSQVSQTNDPIPISIAYALPVINTIWDQVDMIICESTLANCQTAY